MVFSSPIFLFLFLPICLMFYFVVHKFGNIKSENICLLIFSLIFYAYGSIDFLPILLISIIINYVLSKFVDYKNDFIKNKKINEKFNDENTKLVFFIIAICFNILLLIIFKYLNLFTGVFLGVQNSTHIKLPIGISFYTFQVLSYHIDVYKKEVKSSNSLIDFALFTMLFPQLIAGPIVRYSSIDEALKNRNTNIDDVTYGIRRFMIGFTKKILFANNLGKIVDIAFAEINYYDLGLVFSIFVIVCYSMQIYLDFWGYSDMAIGLGKIFGFEFPENFNMPFIATSITEFWNRWHMTLSTFFRDYVYIPLGGSRKGIVRTCINLMIVFTLSGFWHGASFNFLIWGIYNGIFLVIERLIKLKFNFRIYKTIGVLYTFIVWNVGMIFFRLDNIEDILLFINGFISKPHFNYYMRTLINALFSPYFVFLFIISLLYLTPFFGKISSALKRTKYGLIFIDLIVVIFFIYSVMEMLTSGFNPFIYFRF